MSIDVIDTTNEINNLFKKAKVYAEENDIEYIVIFAKGIKNVLNLNNLLKGSCIRLLVTTFPSNQVLYLENEEGVIEEEHPEILNQDSLDILRVEQIKLISSTLPLEPIIIPGLQNNPYESINKTLDIFGDGVSIAVQSVLMSTDTGNIKPSTRVLSLTAGLAIDTEATNSRFLFHPTKGLKIQHIIK